QWQRRSFTFLERWDEQGRRVAPPQFLPVQAVAAAAWPSAPAWDNIWLRECLDQPAACKQACGGPEDVHALPDAAPDTSPQGRSAVRVPSSRGAHAAGRIVSLPGRRLRNEGPRARAVVA